MFGYLVADCKNLSEEEFQQYKAAYCGICSCLRKNGTISGSIALSYDLVFLWLILSSMYEPEEKQISEKCPVHPFKGTPLLLNKFSDYAADVGIMLAYYKAEDDWNDDRNLAKRAAAGILQNRFEAVSRKLPRQSIAIKEQIGRISALEESKSGDIDALCNSFGKLLGELFVYGITRLGVGESRGVGHHPLVSGPQQEGADVSVNTFREKAERPAVRPVYADARRFLVKVSGDLKAEI